MYVYMEGSTTTTITTSTSTSTTTTSTTTATNHSYCSNTELPTSTQKAIDEGG